MPRAAAVRGSTEHVMIQFDADGMLLAFFSDLKTT